MIVKMTHSAFNLKPGILSLCRYMEVLRDAAKVAPEVTERYIGPLEKELAKQAQAVGVGGGRRGGRGRSAASSRARDGSLKAVNE